MTSKRNYAGPNLILRTAIAAALCAPFAAGAFCADAPGEVEARFAGKTPLSESAMKKAVADDLERYLEHGRHPSYLEDAAYRLQTMLKALGYHNARVLARASTAGGKVTAFFETLLGPLAALEEVRIEGNSAIETDELARFFENEKVLPIEFGKRRYVERSVKNAVSDIESLYRDRGFLWVEAAIRETAWSPGKDKATVSVVISEGPKAVLNEVVVGVPGKFGKTLRDLACPVLPCPFSPAMPLRFRNAILKFMAETGFPFSKVWVEPVIREPRPGEKETSVSVRIQLDPGMLGVVDAVKVEGNERTSDMVVRHVSGFAQGQIFSLDRMRAAQADLMRSGLFVSVDPEPVQSPKGGGLVDLRFRVKEADTWEFPLEFDHGDYSISTVRGKALNRNLFGSGRKAWISASADIGDTSAVTRALLGLDDPAPAGKYYEFRAGKLEASISDPWLFYTPFGAQFTWKVEQRAEQTFSSRRAAFLMPVTLKLSSQIKLEAAYKYSFEEVFDALPEVYSGPAFFSISSLTLSLNWDGRDDPFDPKEGGRFRFAVEFAGWFLRGTTDFNRVEVQAYAYASPFDELFTLAFGAEGGVLDPQGDTTQAPPSLLFRKGGDSSVRSFWYGMLGPKSADGTALGGSAYLQFNAEIRVKVWWIFGFAAFFEGGSVKENPAFWLLFNDRRIMPSEGLRLCAGFGLRILTPIGPLRLDLGINPAPLPDEDPWALHFSVGHPF